MSVTVTGAAERLLFFFCRYSVSAYRISVWLFQNKFRLSIVHISQGPTLKSPCQSNPQLAQGFDTSTEYGCTVHTIHYSVPLIDKCFRRSVPLQGILLLHRATAVDSYNIFSRTKCQRLGQLL